MTHAKTVKEDWEILCFGTNQDPEPSLFDHENVQTRTTRAQLKHLTPLGENAFELGERKLFLGLTYVSKLKFTVFRLHISGWDSDLK